MAEPIEKLRVRDAEWTPEHVERQLESLHVERSKHAARVKTRWVVGTGLACAAGVLLALQFADPQEAAPPQDANADASGSDGIGQRTVRFKDGSTAVLQTKDSHLEVTHASNDAVSVELPEGSAHFSIVPSETRHFVVHARGIVVTVLGTEFVVRHEVARTHVKVLDGRVQVDSAEPTRVLTAGEAAWFEVRSAFVEGGAEPEVASVQEEPAPQPKEPAASEKESPRQKFIEAHQRAEYMKAYELLSSHKSSLGSTPEDLMRAADAARYSGHPAEATDYLKQVERRGGGLAQSAAFTLGRLYLHQLGSPTQAASAFARARKLSAGGPLAEDALYREIEARSRAGQTAQAKSLAELYLKSYPNSRRKDSVARWGGLP